MTRSKLEISSAKAKLVASFNLIFISWDIEPQKGPRHKNYVRRPVKNFLKHSFCATPLPLFLGPREIFWRQKF